jgi:hypothetical protein
MFQCELHIVFGCMLLSGVFGQILSGDRKTHPGAFLGLWCVEPPPQVISCLLGS